jgi:uncharacterized protein (TIGR02118 family)
MIKVIGLLTRRPELTHEQFVKHWLEVHGPLAHAVPGVRRYVQSHIIGTRTGRTFRRQMWRSTGSPSCGTTMWRR